MYTYVDVICSNCEKTFKRKLKDVNKAKRFKYTHAFCSSSCQSRFRTNNLIQENPRIYKIWEGMKARCADINGNSSKNYGKRGIKVCDKWKNSFNSFCLWALENGYSHSLSIDRIDNDGNYEPSNCRWATHKQQNNNCSRNIRFKYDGQALTLKQWCEKLGLKYGKIYDRVDSGWNIKRALELE